MKLPPPDTARSIPPDQLAALMERPEPATPAEVDAVRRLLGIAKQDTGQSRRVAAFLLAWWNATSCGGFDLADLWAVDREIGRDMLTVMGLIARLRCYPPQIHPTFETEFREIVRLWRPTSTRNHDVNATQLAPLGHSGLLAAYGIEARGAPQAITALGQMVADMPTGQSSSSHRGTG